MQGLDLLVIQAESIRGEQPRLCPKRGSLPAVWDVSLKDVKCSTWTQETDSACCPTATWPATSSSYYIYTYILIYGICDLNWSEERPGLSFCTGIILGGVKTEAGSLRRVVVFRDGEVQHSTNSSLSEAEGVTIYKLYKLYEVIATYCNC